jgi:hypothetical protein
MLSFVWGRAGSTIKSGRRMFAFTSLKSIRTHTRHQAASIRRRARRPARGKAGGMLRV